MKSICAVFCLSLVVCARAFAVPISLFTDTDTYIERAKDIVIARCVKVPDQQEAFVDGFFPADVEVLMTLKGEKKAGPLKIGTVSAMEAGTTYLLANSGGSAFGSDFLALGELFVVPIPAGFDLGRLKAKTTKQQVQIIFARHLYEIERKLAPLLEQQRLLQKSIEDKTDVIFESQGNVKLSEIKELKSTKRDSTVFLQFEGGPLQYSGSSHGKSGFFYFTDHLPETPNWEFAPTDAKEIAEFDAHPLKTRFYQIHSPNRGDLLGRTGFGNAIYVERGQVILARTSDKPERVYILKIEQPNMDAVSVRYSVIEQ